MRRQRWMRPCAVVLALLMSVALPVEAWATTQGQTAPAQKSAQTARQPVAVTGSDVTYVDANGDTQTAPNATAVTENDTAWSDGWYVVTGDITIGSRVTVNGDVHLILTDGGKLTVNGGIQVVQAKNQLNSLSIYGQTAGTGELNAVATSSENNAGIGGAVYTPAGAITINGGKVTAVGGDASAGIGSGPVSYGGIITINGGHVTASSAANGAGIGGGMQCVGANITINGGTVEATGGNQAAGIGSGTGPAYAPAVVTINGGTVTASGGNQGAGIGDGMGDQQGTTKAANIIISGGTVKANGGYQGAAIGGGAKMPGGKITISGGTVTATGADGASGIGHGGLGATGGEITISGGTVTATGGSGNPGISCQDAPTSQPIGQDGWIVISGGTVIASPKAGEEAHGPAIRGALSTGDTGHALIVAKGTGITDQSNQANWRGVIFDGTSDGKVYGTPTLQTNATLPQGKGLTIPTGSALTIGEGVTLTLNGTTVTVEEGATLTNNGTIGGSGTLTVNGTIGGNGVTEQGVTVPQPQKATVTLTATEATYGEDVTLTAKVAPATNALARNLQRGQMYFFLMTERDDMTLGQAEVHDGVATLTIHLFGETWEKGFALGDNEVAAVYGGDMALEEGRARIILKVNPMSQQAPSAPELDKRDRNSITLKAVENNANGATAEYSKDGGQTWQDSPEFKDLTAGTTYQFVVRYKAVGMYGVSPNSPVAAFSTESAGGGASSGSTVTLPDGTTITTQKNPVTGTVTETTKRPDGSVTIVETQKDGATTTTNKTPTGTTGSVATDKDGQVTKVEGSLSSKDVTQAQKDEKPVKLPVVVPVSPESDTAPRIDIDMPKDSGAVKVEIPVKNPTAGTVAVIVKPNGDQVPVKQSVVTETSVIAPYDGKGVIIIVERSKHFVDVHDADHWAKDAVDFVTARDLFCGTSETHFSPDLSMTRGMLVAVLHRMEGSPALPQENLGYPFSDVTTDDWYGHAVYWARHHGIVSGYNDGRFGPNDTMTREQMVAILYRYAQYKGYDIANSVALDKYTDAAQVSPWAKDAMSWANAEGIVSGTNATTLSPKGSATRAQVASILTRFYGHVVN